MEVNRQPSTEQTSHAVMPEFLRAVSIAELEMVVDPNTRKRMERYFYVHPQALIHDEMGRAWLHSDDAVSDVLTDRETLAIARTRDGGFMVDVTNVPFKDRSFEQRDFTDDCIDEQDWQRVSEFLVPKLGQLGYDASIRYE